MITSRVISSEVPALISLTFSPRGGTFHQFQRPILPFSSMFLSSMLPFNQCYSFSWLPVVLCSSEHFFLFWSPLLYSNILTHVQACQHMQACRQLCLSLSLSPLLFFLFFSFPTSLPLSYPQNTFKIMRFFFLTLYFPFL